MPLVALAGLAVVVAVGFVLAGRPDEIKIPTRTTTAAPAPAASPSGDVATQAPDPGVSPASAAAEGAGSASVVVVHVAGRVVRPGLIRLPAGSRVDDALDAAGGALPGVDLTVLNLARVLSDGEQVAVGVDAAADALPGVGAGAAVSSSSAGGPVDLNKATLAQLDTLPGVGPVLAQRILDWRAANGRFTSVDELQEVSGIGPKLYAGLTPLVRV